MSAWLSVFRCAGCGAVLPQGVARPARCPRATGADDVDHLLRRQLDLERLSWPSSCEASPFARFRHFLHAHEHALQLGWSDEQFLELLASYEAAIASVAGTGFHTTPLREHARTPELPRLWVKDETQGVAGSHKARHLMGIALQLLVQQRAQVGAPPPRLAIASCGNAALAAGVLARAANWELTAFVPDEAEPALLGRLEGLGVRLQGCTRPAGSEGDPCMQAFLGAVEAGAVPFSVQGTQNGQCVEGGQTLAYEWVEQRQLAAPSPGPGPEALFVQVGGGALASACVAALREAEALGQLEQRPRLYCVQTCGVAPLERAWRLAAARLALVLEEARGEQAPVADGSQDPALASWLRARADSVEARAFLESLGQRRSHYMSAWPDPRPSIATGILDDETYDWRLPVEEMLLSGGHPLLVGEERLGQATRMAREQLGVSASPTGAAGLAGLLELAARGAAHELERATVLMTGGRHR